MAAKFEKFLISPDFPINVRKSNQISKNYLERSKSYGQKPLGVPKDPPGLNRVKSFDVLPLTAMLDHCCLRASIKSNLLVPPSCESELDTVKLNQLSNGFWSDKASMELFRNILLSFDY